MILRGALSSFSIERALKIAFLQKLLPSMPRMKVQSVAAMRSGVMALGAAAEGCHRTAESSLSATSFSSDLMPFMRHKFCLLVKKACTGFLPIKEKKKRYLIVQPIGKRICFQVMSVCIICY